MTKWLALSVLGVVLSSSVARADDEFGIGTEKKMGVGVGYPDLSGKMWLSDSDAVQVGVSLPFLYGGLMVVGDYVHKQWDWYDGEAGRLFGGWGAGASMITGGWAANFGIGAHGLFEVGWHFKKWAPLEATTNIRVGFDVLNMSLQTYLSGGALRYYF